MNIDCIFLKYFFINKSINIKKKQKKHIKKQKLYDKKQITKQINENYLN